MLKAIKACVLCTFCTAATAFLISGVVTARQDLPAEKVYKNIQALKGIPANQLPNLMIGYGSALGVDCDYCHVSGAFEKTDKPTHVSALRDIQMTRDLNSRYQMAVDCMSCHHGTAKPSTSAPLALGNPSTTPSTPEPEVSTPPASTQPSAPATPPPATKPAVDKPPATPPAEKNEASTPGAPPGKVSFKASYGAVAFDHDQHSAAFDCTICHHTNKDASETLQKCSVCHLKAPGSITKVTAKDVAHGTKTQRNCAGCHTTSGSGPTKCSECHKR